MTGTNGSGESLAEQIRKLKRSPVISNEDFSHMPLCNAGALPSDDNGAFAALPEGKQAIRAAQNAYYTTFLRYDRMKETNPVVPVGNESDMLHDIDKATRNIQAVYATYHLEGVAKDIAVMGQRAAEEAKATAADVLADLKESIPPHDETSTEFGHHSQTHKNEARRFFLNPPTSRTP